MVPKYALKGFHLKKNIYIYLLTIKLMVMTSNKKVGARENYHLFQTLAFLCDFWDSGAYYTAGKKAKN